MRSRSSPPSHLLSAAFGLLALLAAPGLAEAKQIFVGPYHDVSRAVVDKPLTAKEKLAKCASDSAFTLDDCQRMFLVPSAATTKQDVDLQKAKTREESARAAQLKAATKGGAQKIEVNNNATSNSGGNRIQATSITEAVLGRRVIAWTNLPRYGMGLFVPVRFELRNDGNDARQEAIAVGVGVEAHGGIFSVMERSVVFAWYGEFAWLRGSQLTVSAFDAATSTVSRITGGTKADHLTVSFGLDLLAGKLVGAKLGYVYDYRASSVDGPDENLRGIPSTGSHGMRAALRIVPFGWGHQISFDLFNWKETFYPTNPDNPAYINYQATPEQPAMKATAVLPNGPLVTTNFFKVMMTYRQDFNFL